MPQNENRFGSVVYINAYAPLLIRAQILTVKPECGLTQPCGHAGARVWLSIRSAPVHIC
jgi:hypothetical protein